MRESMWSGLNDLWIYKAFTYKCVQKREKEERQRVMKMSQPKAWVRFMLQLNASLTLELLES